MLEQPDLFEARAARDDAFRNAVIDQRAPCKLEDKSAQWMKSHARKTQVLRRT